MRGEGGEGRAGLGEHHHPTMTNHSRRLSSGFIPCMHVRGGKGEEGRESREVGRGE